MNEIGYTSLRKVVRELDELGVKAFFGHVKFQKDTPLPYRADAHRALRFLKSPGAQEIRPRPAGVDQFHHATSDPMNLAKVMAAAAVGDRNRFKLSCLITTHTSRSYDAWFVARLLASLCVGWPSHRRIWTVHA